jgi:hypothetical protein
MQICSKSNKISKNEKYDRTYVNTVLISESLQLSVYKIEWNIIQLITYREAYCRPI